MKNEHESEYDTEMSGDEGHTDNSLTSRNKVDDTMKSLMDTFEVFIPVLLQWHVMHSCSKSLNVRILCCIGRW